MSTHMEGDVGIHRELLCRISKLHFGFHISDENLGAALRQKFRIPPTATKESEPHECNALAGK
jgi:hypothetical protein